jgi:hypothetical protein
MSILYCSGELDLGEGEPGVGSLLKLGQVVLGDLLDRGASPTNERRLILFWQIVHAQATATLPIPKENHTKCFANNGLK